MTFSGSLTALITPFNRGAIDEDAFARLVDWQIENGTHGLVPVGTTGESPTLNHEEHNHITELCVKFAKGRVPVMAGTGSNATGEAIMMTQFAERAGADGALLAAPYYNKPTQEGLYQHYKAIHDATDIPLVVYNIPGRSVVDISDETLLRLAELPRIVGVKDATGDLERPKALQGLDNFIQLSGEDDTAVDFNRLGGVGCISVTANIAPKLCSEMQSLCLEGKFDEADAINAKLAPLHAAMFAEVSPQPVKYAAELLGFGDGSLRLPLIDATDATKQQVKAAMEALDLI